MTVARINFVTDLVCLVCGRHVPDGNVQTCPGCGSEGILDVRYDYFRASRTLTRESVAGRNRDLWLYAELLPVTPAVEKPPLHIGWTPIYAAPRLAKEVGIQRVYLKDEGRNPTGSFKDRASAIAVMKARSSMHVRSPARRRGMPPRRLPALPPRSDCGASYFFRSAHRCRR